MILQIYRGDIKSGSERKQEVYTILAEVRRYTPRALTHSQLSELETKLLTVFVCLKILISARRMKQKEIVR
jgi:hypothetical protein